MSNDTPNNGSYVTWREFNLAMQPLKEKIESTAEGVDRLLEIHAGDTAIQTYKNNQRALRFAIYSLLVALAGSIATVVWLSTG